MGAFTIFIDYIKAKVHTTRKLQRKRIHTHTHTHTQHYLIVLTMAKGEPEK